MSVELAWAIMILISVWAVCSVLAYGITFAFFQFEYPAIARKREKEDQDFAWKFAALGPVALAVCVILGLFRHGFKWHRK